MADIKQIRRPVEDAMVRYEEYARGMLGAATPQLEPIAGYILRSQGKAIRPLVVMLAAGMLPEAADTPGRRTTGAMLIEMLHKASLVHDDVIDGSYMRRSAPSVNALWGDHRAVLAGDYIIARALSQGLADGHADMVQCVCDSLWRVCEGEMLQSWQSDRLQMTREVYFEIIFKKTALVLGTSAALGAMAARAPQRDVDALRTYGEMLGQAFQIRDDVLDYMPASQTGKPACGDLRERKINMPLLAVLEDSSPSHRTLLLRKLSDIRRKPENADYLARAVMDGGGIEKATGVMDDFLRQAAIALEPYPASPCKSSLIELCDYVAERNK